MLFIREAIFYSIVCSCSLCQILIDHRDLDLFLGSLFHSIVLCVCSYASIRLFWLQWPCKYSLISGIVIPPTLFFFLKIAAGIWGHLRFHINFWKNVCSISVKCAIGTLVGIALSLWIDLGSMDILMMLILPIYEHGIHFHLFVYSLISSLGVV